MKPTPGGPFAWRTFELGFEPWMRRKLQGVYLTGLPDPSPPADLPLLLVANHTSWFDGFLLRAVQRELRPRGVLRTIMLTRELDDRWILRALGGLGFDPSRPQTLRGVLRTLRDLRSVPAGLTVSFFPQGRIHPAWQDPPAPFRPGLRLLFEALAPARILPVAIHLEMGSHTRPTAYLSAGPLLDDNPVAGAEAAVNRELGRIREHLAHHGESAAEAWPPRRPG